MLLSDAIMMNGVMREQGFGSASLNSVNAPCALGGALQSIGRQKISHEYCADISFANFQMVGAVWPWTDKITSCPGCNVERRTLDNIWHMNDLHRWTRAQIAEWVAGIEPPETIEKTEVTVYETQIPSTEEKGEMVHGK